MSILSGIKVLDFSHYIAGPFCSQMLGDHGADVIKVEQIGGETGRIAKPFHQDESLYFAVQNRNKRALSINLKSNEGQEIVSKLVENSDILITNYGAGVPERLGIDFETISNINPEISMIHITGFGLNGPYKNHRAYDGIIQNMSGIASMTGHPDGPPTIVGTYIADHLAGLQAALGAMIALFHRERTGKGIFIDVSMLDSMLSMLGHRLSEVITTGVEHKRNGNRDLRSFCTTLPTLDGFVYIAPLTPKMWEDFCTLINKEEWFSTYSPYSTSAGRLEHRDVLEREITEWTKQFTKKEVFEMLQQVGIASGPVNTLKDIANDTHVKERDMIRKIKVHSGEEIFVNGVPIKIKDHSLPEFTPPPRIGEHSTDILADIGYSTEKINHLLENGVISSYKQGNIPLHK
ncbi:CaiB/BaiF CoA transferase family protein [Peribacillus butanolivorans]|uniref:CaiB/BaiF CoA transferase family protein n=1 Tax=Peribacillus butanolivorans TaxID=421767 RepID=UPI00364875FA